jgi:alpha-glucosidase
MVIFGTIGKRALFILAWLSTVIFTSSAATPNQLVWWKTGVIYQIYPRSFLDGCEPKCSGNGTLSGITKKLTYLKSLGITAIWISPFYESPQKDFGYDISNFKDVGKIYGTMKDFDNLMTKAKTLNLRIIMDLVPNHSSNEHEWFVESKSSKTNSKRDWYIWKEGKKNASGTTIGPPNNWRTMFCMDSTCSGWEYDVATDEYYYHCFLKEQPDFNWRNPDLQNAYLDILRFWLKKGVDGFRVDAFAYMLEDPEFRDEPIDENFKGDPVKDGYSKLIHTRTENIEGLHGLIQKMRGVCNEFGSEIMMIGEIYGDQVVSQKDVMSYYGKSRNEPELSMPFNMNLLGFFGGGFTDINYEKGMEPWRSGSNLRDMMRKYYDSLPSFGYPNNVLGNHDVHRVRSRLKSVNLMKVATTILLTVKGTPTIYNGDEIAMANGFVPNGTRQDPTCKVSYEGMRCRDPERTPLQWDSSNNNSGFTNAVTTPWLPVSSDYINNNVELQEEDTYSMLNMVKGLLKLRQSSSTLNHGNYKDHDVNGIKDQHTLYIYQRYSIDKTDPYVFLVINNLGLDTAKFKLKHPNGEEYTKCHIVFDSLEGIYDDDDDNDSLRGKRVVELNTIDIAGERSYVVQCKLKVTLSAGLIILFVFLGVLIVTGIFYILFRLKKFGKIFNNGALHYSEFDDTDSNEFDHGDTYRGSEMISYSSRSSTLPRELNLADN